MKTIVFTLLFLLSALTAAHPVPCPRCGLLVVQATKDRDNEVVLRYGNKRIEYRCVDCALADAKKYGGDLFVYAPSETKGKPVILQRKAGTWSAVRVQGEALVPEEGVVFLDAFDKHPQCATLARAFHTVKAFAAYPDKPKDAQPLTLDALLAKAAK